MLLLSHLLRRFVRTGTLRIIDAAGTSHVFSGAPGPIATCRLHDKSLPLKIFLNPELIVGEAYMDGSLTLEDCTLYDFLLLFSLNRRSLGQYPLQALLRSLWRKFRSLQQYNPIGKAQQNVAHHYDLSRKLYELFLDEDLQYSCAFFEHPDDTLEQAQENKKRHIAAKLCLEPGQRVVELGCGWGGLALYLARVAGVDVTAVTLSREQHKVAQERARALGLQERVHFHLRDFRELTGRFDRVVSVGMLEHVGAPRYRETFAKISSLLTDDGVALVHAIGKNTPPSTAGPWLRKYIFPGAYTPALSEVFTAVEKEGLWVNDVEVLRLHYAETLREWHTRFQAKRAEVLALYDERFCRMWEFYLLCCEMVFRHGSGMVFHMQLARQRDAVPQTRDYIAQKERAYSQLDAAWANTSRRRAS